MKVTIERQWPEGQIKPMNEMFPGEIGVIVPSEPTRLFIGEVVMRTFSTNHFEVMSLSNPENDGCWTRKTKHMVKIYQGAELKVILK